MSASMSATRCPSRASAAARFADTVDLPTPPLPLEIASTLPSDGISSGVGGGGGGGGVGAAGRPDGPDAWRSPAPAESTTFTCTPPTPGTAAAAFRACRANEPGSSLVSTNVNVTAPLGSTVTSRTIPADTMSRPWRGLMTAASACSTWVLRSVVLTGIRPRPRWSESGAPRSGPLLRHPPSCRAATHPPRGGDHRRRTGAPVPPRRPRPSSGTRP